MVVYSHIMKINVLVWWLPLLCFPMNTTAFLAHPRKQYRRIRLQYAMLLKKNDLAFDKPTQQSVVENMSMIVKDDLTNDMLYFLKFYQLTNDEQSSYFYIVFYELLSFIIRNDPNKLSQFHVSLLNMFVYILLKNIVLNHFIHHHY